MSLQNYPSGLFSSPLTDCIEAGLLAIARIIFGIVRYRS